VLHGWTSTDLQAARSDQNIFDPAQMSKFRWNRQMPAFGMAKAR
jgi:hypothetical protein